MSDWVRCDQCERMATPFQSRMNHWFRVESCAATRIGSELHFCTWACLTDYATREQAGRTQGLAAFAMEG